MLFSLRDLFIHGTSPWGAFDQRAFSIWLKCNKECSIVCRSTFRWLVENEGRINAEPRTTKCFAALPEPHPKSYRIQGGPPRSGGSDNSQRVCFHV